MHRNSRLLMLFWIVLALAWLKICVPTGFFNPASLMGFDFQLRYNEIQCVLSGVDPHLIQSGETKLGEYLPFSWETKDSFSLHSYVYGYPPWEYTFMLPFALLPKLAAAKIWLSFEFLCAVCLLVAIFFYCRGADKAVWKGCLGLVFAFSALWPIAACISCLNFGVVIAALAALMCAFLDRRKDVLAGICWALMMVKPQTAMLFAVPLLFRGKFKVILVAVLVCVVAMLLPAALCGRNPLEMILELRSFGSDYASEGTFAVFLLPAQLLRSWCVGEQTILGLNFLTGVFICFIMTMIWRKSRNWLLVMLPAILLSNWWTVSRAHDACILILSLAAVGLVAFESLEKPFWKAPLCALLFVGLCLWYRHGLGRNVLLSSIGLVPIGATCIAALQRRNLHVLADAFPLLLFPMMIVLSPLRFDAYLFSFLYLGAVSIVGRLEGRAALSAVLILLPGVPAVFAFAPLLGLPFLAYSAIGTALTLGCILNSRSGERPSTREAEESEKMGEIATGGNDF